MDRARLQLKLNQFNEKFSDNSRLVKILNQILEYDEEDRPNFLEVLNRLALKNAHLLLSDIYKSKTVSLNESAQKNQKASKTDKKSGMIIF